MIKTILIDDFEEVKNLVFEQERNLDNGRYRSSYFYRGVPDAAYDLSTSLSRNCADRAGALEMPMLENFTKYASIEDPTINESIWKAMIVGQHHGLPTRLLDWTHSPLVALHFAETERNLNDLNKRDCAVWRIDAKELNQKLPEKYKEALKQRNTFIFSFKLLAELAKTIQEYDKDMKSDSLLMVEPPSIDQRIVGQYSFFTVLPTGINDLEKFLNENTEHTVKYVISRNLRWDLRDILDQLNMNERTVYPGIDGIAAWIARHYYVRTE